MEKIADYLKKFSILLNSEYHKRDLVIAEIKNTIGISLDKKTIQIKNMVVSIQTNPITRNSIHIKKRQILKNLAVKGCQLTDIR